MMEEEVGKRKRRRKKRRCGRLMFSEYLFCVNQGTKTPSITPCSISNVPVRQILFLLY
jgi:hypothetical protein